MAGGCGPLPPIEELNGLPADEFAAVAGAAASRARPRFLARLATARPFGGYDDLGRPRCEIARAMPEAEQVELIDAHPRLGAPPASVSAMSFREQGYGTSEGQRQIRSNCQVPPNRQARPSRLARSQPSSSA